MADVGIDLHFNDNRIVADWQQQISLSKQLVENVQQLQTNLNASTNKLSTQLDGLSKSTKKTNSDFGGLFSTLKGLASFAGISILVSKMKEFGTAALKSAGEIEKMRVTFATFLGSTAKANEALDIIQKFSGESLFTQEEIFNAGKRLLALNVPVKDLEGKLKTIGDIAAGTGRRIDELVTIYAKVQNQGRVQGDEMLQIAEAGIPIYDILIEQLGVSRIELNKMQEAGLITADIFNKAFLSMGEAGGKFFGLVEAQSNTFLGQVSKLQKEFDLLGRQLGEAALPAFKVAVDLASNAINGLLTSIKDLINSETDQINKSGEVIKFAKLEAKAGQELLDRYEALTAKGVKPTAKSKEELRSITFQLRDAFGDSIGKINEETGAFEVNSQAIRDSIKERLLLADQEALSLANKILAAKENKKILQQQTIDAKAALAEQSKILADANISPDVNLKTSVAGDFRSDRLGQAPAGLQKNIEGFQKAMSAANIATIQIAKADQTILEGLDKLKESGFSEADVDKLISNAVKVKTAITAPPTGNGDKLKKLLDDLRKKYEELRKEVEKQSISTEAAPRRKAELEYQAELKRIATLEAEIKRVAALAGRKADVTKEILALQNYAEIEYKKTLSIIELNEAKVRAELADKGTDALEGRLKARSAKEKKAREKQLKELEDHNKVLSAQTDQDEAKERGEIEKQVDLKIIAKEAGEVKLLETERVFHLKRMEQYRKQKEDEAKINGRVYDPTKDAEQIGLETQLIELNFKIDTAKLKKPFEDIGSFIQDALGFDDATFKAVEDAFGKMAQSIVSSWKDATQAQIDANEELQDDLDKRHDRAQEALETEIELEKLGYATNVELRQQQLADIQAAEKQAQIDGIALKKKAARQDLILSELQAGASLTETIAKTFSANASLPFGAGIIISGVIIAGMLAQFAAYKSKLRSAESSIALYTGGRPIDHLQPGESPKSDYMGRGKGHQIGGTNMYMSAYEMVLKEKTTNANLPFWEMANTGAFDNIDLMQMIRNGGSQLPNIEFHANNLKQIADNKDEYMRQQDHAVMERAIHLQTERLINYWDNRAEYVFDSQKNQIIEFKKNTITRQ